MKAAPKPDNEEARMAALREAELLDTPPEALWDDLALLASTICGTPIALVSLVDADRQWFKAKVGLDASETHRDVAFCAHAILDNQLFIVADATADPRFADNPLVTDAPNVRFYAGAPLITVEGHALGTLCVIDHVVRQLTPTQIAALEALGRHAVGLIEARNQNRRLKLEELARQRANAESEAFFSVALDLMCIANVDGTFQTLNPAWEKVLGYPLPTLTGARFMDFVHPEDVTATGAEIAKLAQGAPTVGFRHRFRHADGAYRLLEWRAAPDVHTGRLYAAARDITEITLTTQRMQRILEAAGSGMVVVDEHGSITFVNREAARLFGYSAQELVGQPIESLGAQSTDVPSAHTLRDDFERSLAAGTHSDTRTLRARNRDGQEIVVEVILTPLDSPEGPTVLLTLVDATARAAVEKMKDEFVSIVSHELRTPLTSIRGSLRLLEGGAMGALEPQVDRLVRLASSNTERLIRLINDILDVEKMHAGKLELVLSSITFEEAARAATNTVLTTSQLASVSLDVEVPAGLTFVADADRLTQVLVNLLSNAVKFSPPGSRVSLKGSVLPDGGVRFSVSDQGPGIAAADVPRLFAKFQQLDASATRKKGGSGLGLSICKAIVERHGGSVGVESTLGQGATFWFTLPPVAASERAAQQDSSEAQVQAQVAPLGTALVIAAGCEATQVIRDALAREGLDAHTAATAAAARALLATISPRVIIVDMAMPDGVGFETLDWLRGNATFRNTPVIVVGETNPLGEEEAKPFVATWVSSPLDPAAVSSALDSLRVRGRSRRALVIEDDDSTRQILVENLRRIGVEVLEAANGRDALRIAQTHIPDVIVLDVGLPIIDGFSVINVLRAGPNHATPLVVFTGRELREPERAALTLGLTRYVTKAGANDDDLINAVRALLQPAEGTSA